MNLSEPSPNDDVHEYVQRGELARATSLLLRRIDERLTQHGTAFPEIAELVHLYVRQSRYKEAFAQAQTLDRSLRLRHVPFAFTLFFAHCISLLKGFSAEWIHGLVRRVLRPVYGLRSPSQEYRLIDAVLWGYYWQDMRTALRLNLCLWLAAHDTSTEIQAEAFLNYTLAYMGFSTVGLWGLKRNVDRLVEDKSECLHRKFLVWLGVAYQMNARPRECLEAHRELRDKCGASEPFELIVSYASQLNMSISELGPREAAVAADESFKASVALRESRNHIQVYGGKACLLALEGRRNEADSYIERARQTADRNCNTLDEIIFHRLAAIAHLNMDAPGKALEHVVQGRALIKKYARVMSYVHEFNRLEAVANATASGSGLGQLRATLIFFLKGQLIFHRKLWLKTWRITFQFIREPSPSYWNLLQKEDYFRERVRSLAMAKSAATFERVALGLSHNLLHSDVFNGETRPDRKQLASLIEQVLPDEEIVFAPNLTSALQTIRNRYGVSGSFISNEESDSLHVACADGRFFIAVKTPAVATDPEPFVIGVLTSDLEIGAQDPIEMALRVMANLYVSANISWQARVEKIKNAERFALAGLASQVSHDIRSPLSALSMLARMSDDMPDERRHLLQNAVGRINDIANILLKKGGASIAEIAMPQALSDPEQAVTFTNIMALVDSVVSEKKMEFLGRNHVLIWEQSFQYGLFVGMDSLELARVISNLINNAVEALEHNGRICISLESDDRYVNLTIVDNGRGIPENIRARLGEPGVTFGKTSSSKSGFGLGLSHAFTSVRSAGGQVTVRSQVGQGTSVSVCLPRVSSPKWLVAQIDLTKNRELIVVDDDRAIHESWRSRISSRIGPDARVRCFSSLNEFEMFLSKKEPDLSDSLVLIDYEFRNSTETGLDFVERRLTHHNVVLASSRIFVPEIIRRAERIDLKLLEKRDLASVPISI